MRWDAKSENWRRSGAAGALIEDVGRATNRAQGGGGQKTVTKKKGEGKGASERAHLLQLAQASLASSAVNEAMVVDATTCSTRVGYGSVGR
jgi:hypothetical protein